MTSTLLVICIPLAFWLAMSRRVPALVPWVVPLALAALFFVAWRQETTATSGDPQPGLLALVGKVSVGLALVAMLLGYLVRYRSGRHDED